MKTKGGRINRRHYREGITMPDGFQSAHDLRCKQIMGCDIEKAFEFLTTDGPTEPTRSGRGA